MDGDTLIGPGPDGDYGAARAQREMDRIALLDSNEVLITLHGFIGNDRKSTVTIPLNRERLMFLWHALDVAHKYKPAPALPAPDTHNPKEG